MSDVLIFYCNRSLCDSLNLETAVGSQKSTQALGALSKIKKCLITHKVTTIFFISPCTPIPYASFLRPTAVSRFNHASGSCHATWNSLRILSLPLPDACRAETRHLSHIQIIPVGGIVVPNTAEIIWKEYSSKQAKGVGWCLDYDRGQA